jgi:hypothetical protein
MKHFNNKLIKGSYFSDLIYNKDMNITLFYISLFVSSDLIAIMQNNKTIKEHNLNRVFCEEYISSNEYEYLSAFNIKDTFPANFLSRLFYKFYVQKDSSDIIEKIINYLENDIQLKIKNQSGETTKEYIENSFQKWQEEVLPIWKRVGII